MLFTNQQSLITYHSPMTGGARYAQGSEVAAVHSGSCRTMAIDSESFRELRACPACHAEALGGGGSAVEWVNRLYPSGAKAKLWIISLPPKPAAWRQNL